MQPLVLADVTRPEPLQDQPVHGKQNIIARIFSDWLKAGVQTAFEKPLQTGLWDDNEQVGPTTAPRMHFPVQEIYRLMGSRPSFGGWVNLFDATPSAEILALLAPYFDQRFVVGFELSPFLLKVLNDLGVPYVNFAVHPIRFMPDYLFQVESNFVPRAALADYKVAEEHIAFEAHIWRNSQAHRGFSGLDAGSAIVFGQEEYDASLIAEGNVSRLEQYSAALSDLSSSHKTVYFKPHPYARHIGSQIAFMRQFKNVRTINANPYRLLADPAIATVAAQSSSVLTEAEIFGKDICPLWPKWTSKANSAAYRVDILSRSFWARVLEPDASHGTVVPYDLSRGGLKRLLGFSWSEHGQDQEPNPKEPVQAGAVVRFGHQDLAGIVLQPGSWYAPEPDHCWMKPGAAAFSVKLPEQAGRPFDVEITFAAMANEDHPITCDILSGDLLLTRHVFRHTDTVTERFEIPAELVNAMGEFTLKLVSPYGNNPVMISGSPDKRLMAVQIQSLRVFFPPTSQPDA